MGTGVAIEISCVSFFFSYASYVFGFVFGLHWIKPCKQDHLSLLLAKIKTFTNFWQSVVHELAFLSRQKKIRTPPILKSAANKKKIVWIFV